MADLSLPFGPTQALHLHPDREAATPWSSANLSQAEPGCPCELRCSMPSNWLFAIAAVPCAQASVPIGYVDAFLPAASRASPFPVPVPAVRAAAVQLLISYMGATLGSLAAVRAFVQQAIAGYRCAMHVQVERRGSAVRSVGLRHRWQRTA